MKKHFFATILLLFTIHAGAQIKSHLYKGLIDGKMPVTLFLNEEENGCGGDPFLTAMYRYDKVSQWLQLNIAKSEKEQYVMVEFGFTGLMILKKEGKTFNGIWISPDGKRQLSVTLKETTFTQKELETYLNKMEQVHYENHDC